MRLENAVAADVLERILSAYGFTMQKELSDKLGIAKSNVASWLQRGQVPGNVLVQCALDTGADVHWLVNGEFAKANKISPTGGLRPPSLVGRSLIDSMLQSGGRAVLQRIMEAYKFNTQKELSDHLGISPGTISTWVRRQFFPGDVVIACAIETGVKLEWLAAGLINDGINYRSEIISDFSYRVLEQRHIQGGKLIAGENYLFDSRFIPEDAGNAVYIVKNIYSWIVDISKKDLSNGYWILEIDGNCDVYEVARVPGNKISITNKTHTIECNVNDVNAVGLVLKTINNNH